VITLLPIKLADTDAERVRRTHHDAITELQQLRMTGARLLEGVELEDGVPTLVAHGLGRRVAVFPSAIRGASSSGRIDEIRDGVDFKKFVKLEANGYGATITVDLWVL
jgi:hypothetical protein